MCFVHQLADLKTDTTQNLWLHKLMSNTLKTTLANILMTALVSLAQATMMKSQVDVVTFQSQRLTQPKFENAEVKIRRRFHHQIGIGTSRHHNLVSHFFVLHWFCFCCVFWPAFECCAQPKAGQNTLLAVYRFLNSYFYVFRILRWKKWVLSDFLWLSTSRRW